MKRKDLVRTLGDFGCVLLREGGGHSIYQNPRTKRTISVPRHTEINEYTAMAILREAAK